MPTATCPNCRKPARCHYDGDAGVTHEFWDKYVLECDHCGHRAEELVSGGSSAWCDWFTSCPHCGRDARGHNDSDA